jgi:pSer/pThr/pTyr-binding forkhead associated (FHA) protein
MFATANTTETIKSRYPSVERAFSLIDHSTHTAIALQAGENAVGRSEFCPVRFNNSFISRVHAVLSVLDTKVIVRDCNSTHGTFLNGNRLTGAHVLRDGDRIRFAHIELSLTTK